MDIWDRLCSYLHVQAVSVEDVSNKVSPQGILGCLQYGALPFYSLMLHD